MDLFRWLFGGNFDTYNTDWFVSCSLCSWDQGRCVVDPSLPCNKGNPCDKGNPCEKANPWTLVRRAISCEKGKLWGGAKHFAKPYVEPSLLIWMTTLSWWWTWSLTKVDWSTAGICWKTCSTEIHSGAFRTRSMGLLTQTPEINNTRFWWKYLVKYQTTKVCNSVGTP